MKKTIGELQEYIKKINKERGFEDTTVPELFMYLSEEVGEVAKAARRMTKMHVDSSSRIDVEEERKELGHEIADVLSYLLDLSNRFGIDLDQAFWEKEEINRKRVWSKKGSD